MWGILQLLSDLFPEYFSGPALRCEQHQGPYLLLLLMAFAGSSSGVNLRWFLPISLLPTGLVKQQGTDRRLVPCTQLLLGKAISSSSRYPGAPSVQTRDNVALLCIRSYLDDYLCNREKYKPIFPNKIFRFEICGGLRVFLSTFSYMFVSLKIFIPHGIGLWAIGERIYSFWMFYLRSVSLRGSNIFSLQKGFALFL